MKIFSGTSNEPLAQKIAKNLGIQLSNLEVFVFPDGEKRIRVLDKVLDENVVIVQSTSSPVDENYMQLFFIIDALKRGGAKSVTAVVPYFGYQRQDHMFREGEDVSVKVVAEILDKLGINKLIAVDLHSVKIEEAFNTLVSNLSALSIFAKIIRESGWNKDSAILVSPDMGGIRRIKILSEMLNNMPFAVIEKNRDLATGIISAEKIEGKVGKKAIIVDDMISSGKTIAIAAELLRKNGAEEVCVFATHPVFSSQAPKILQESEIKKVYVTDTVYIPEEKRFPKLEILSVAEKIAENMKSA
jgi:ribose-phosphate pyrophosphokinase